MIIVKTNCDTKQEAISIIDELLKKRLIFLGFYTKAKSKYLWKGNIIQGNEFIISCRTTKNNYKKVIEMIKEIHSYEVPPIYVLTPSDSNADYLKYFAKELN
ncbi:MAG: divalent cation tolerance protein CutA [Nanoarchaeota archaeon]|nr:divalent cation tolerance protein CutA [Nanoarchaeota archaeon]